MSKKSVTKIESSSSGVAEAAVRNVDSTTEASSKTSRKAKENFGKTKAFTQKREENSTKYSKLNAFLLAFFPIFICSLAEINQGKYVSSFINFIVEKPTVILFDFLLTAIVFAFLLFILKKGWLAVLLHTILYMALSTTELFKYGTNGNHLILSDMKLLRSVKSLSSFAYIKITPRLISYYIIAIAFILIVVYFNPKIKASPIKRIAMICASVLSVVALIVLPAFYKPVYKVFGIDTKAATNSFILNEKFQNNRFIAFIIQTASESYSNRLIVPDTYNEEHIDQIMNIHVDDQEDFNGGKKPNVVVIMSESMADFRVFDELDVDDKYYSEFDKAISEGKGGIAITPTYASWTVRSEFELLFGLPVRGINTPNMPQRELAECELPALAQYYKSWGYNTIYLHPFQSSFYSRSKIYGRFGFEKMIYHDDQDGTTDFTVPVEHFGTYMDDSSVFNQILKEISTSDRPVYLHTTTMQNHQPYDQGDDPNDEFTNYLTRVKHTNNGLESFLKQLKSLDEPVLVFFVGDHFPSLRGETSVYNQLGLNGENCKALYQQKYLLWSNYDADFSCVPNEEISFFYVPYVLLNIIDAPRDAFIEKMNAFMEKEPVYSEEYSSTTPRDDELDLLTIDRVVKDKYSPSPVHDEELTTMD